MNKNIIVIVSIIVLLIIALFVWSNAKQDETETVNSFEECVEAGYPVMESYPRQCAAPSGQTFTEEVGEVPVDINVNVEEE